MKLKTQLIALSNYALIAKDNTLSISSIFDEIRVSALPGGVARAFLVATVVGSPNTTYKLTIKLESADGKQTLKSNNMTIVSGHNGKSNIIVELVGLAFEKAGDYRFVIYEGDKEIGSVEVKVIHVQQKGEVSFKLPN